MPAPARSSSGRDVWGHRPGPKGFKTVIIDAGHGGKDAGATSRHTCQKEKDLTLDMAKRIRAELGGNFRTILMRSDDTFVDLDDRVIRANRFGDAVLISMHFNSGPSHIRGPETYYWRVDSHGLAVRCQRAMNAVSPAETANRGLVRRRLRLTRNPEIPGVLLEGGYLSNSAESQLIANPGYRQKLASRHRLRHPHPGGHRRLRHRPAAPPALRTTQPPDRRRGLRFETTPHRTAPVTPPASRLPTSPPPPPRTNRCGCSPPCCSCLTTVHRQQRDHRRFRTGDARAFQDQQDRHQAGRRNARHADAGEKSRHHDEKLRAKPICTPITCATNITATHS